MDRKQAIEKLKDLKSYTRTSFMKESGDRYNDALDMAISSLKTDEAYQLEYENREVKEVVHAKWIPFFRNKTSGDNTEKCSNCNSYWRQAIIYDKHTGDFMRIRLNFCPSCGAKMDKPQESEDKE